MPLVLSAKTGRDGLVKRFDVVRAENAKIEQGLLDDIEAGEYKVMDGSHVEDVKVSYRVVQDIVRS